MQSNQKHHAKFILQNKRQTSQQNEQIRTKNQFFYHSSLVECFDDLKQHFHSVLINFVTKFKFCSNKKSISRSLNNKQRTCIPRQDINKVTKLKLIFYTMNEL
ncbi:hypothetical protein ABPG74_011278 [Tetrahymena malaccensis]